MDDCMKCELVPCTPCCRLQNNQNIPYLVAYVVCTHVGELQLPLKTW